MSQDSTSKRPSWIGISLALLPLWLVGSAGVAIYLSLTRESGDDAETQQRFMQEMSVDRIRDDLGKLERVIGERNLASEAGRRNLSRTASMIEGILGPQNTGYRIDRIAGPDQWPILRAKLPAKSSKAAALWVLTAYDTPHGSVDSSGVAAIIAIAQAMARDELRSEIHFIFLPHGHDPSSSLADTLGRLKAIGTPPAMVFHIGGMDGPGKLVASSRESGSTLLQSLGELGSFQDQDSDRQTTADPLADAGFKSVRVRTLPAPDPDSDAEHIAIAAGRLVEWIRRCDNLATAD